MEAAPDTEVHGVKVSDNVTLAEVSVAIAKSIEEAETPVKAQIRKLDQILTVQEVKGFKLAQFVQLVQQFCKKEDLADFFGAVSSWLSSARQTSKS